MEMKAGARLRSVVCETEVVVVRAPTDEVDLWCGGRPMVAIDDAVEPGGTPEAGQDTGTLLGKRYGDEASGLEVLCTKAGAGSLSLAGVALPVKGAKPLPASD